MKEVKEPIKTTVSRSKLDMYINRYKESIGKLSPGQLVSLIAIALMVVTIPLAVFLALNPKSPLNSRANPVTPVTPPSGTGWVNGSINLQGRTDNSGVRVSLFNDSGEIVSLTTDAAGEFNFEVSVGQYTIVAEADYYLDAEKTSIWVYHGTYTTLGTPTLEGGDTNDDDVVDQIDLDFIQSKFGVTCKGKDKKIYDAAADINADCLINIQDASIAGGNFGKTSPVIWPNSPVPTQPPPVPGNNEPVITTESIPDAKFSRRYNATIEGYDLDLNDTLVMQASGLPSGLDLGSCRASISKKDNLRKISCKISGNSGERGLFNVEVVLKDNRSSVSKTFVLSVK